MFSVFVPSESALKRVVVEDMSALPENAVWIDLVNPSAAEDKAVERLAGIAIPTREDMQEIEISSRLYIENGARYMTATLMCHSDTDMPRTTAVTFILGDHRLVTVRYDLPKPFALVEAKLGRSCTPSTTADRNVTTRPIETRLSRTFEVKSPLRPIEIRIWEYLLACPWRSLSGSKMSWLTWSISAPQRSRMSAQRSMTASSSSISTASPVMDGAQERANLASTRANGLGWS